IGARAAVDDHRHVRVVLVVRDHALEELAFEFTRYHAIDHCRPTISLYEWIGRIPVLPRRLAPRTAPPGARRRAPPGGAADSQRVLDVREDPGPRLVARVP